MSATPTKQSIFEWEYNYYKVKQEKVEDNGRRAAEREMAACTFAPAIAQPRRGRSFSSFLQDQRDYSHRRDEVLADLKAIKEEQESNNYRCAPEISEVQSGTYARIEFKRADEGQEPDRGRCGGAPSSLRKP